MFDNLKKMKIKQAVIILGIVAFLATSLVGGISLLDIAKTNASLDNIYNERLVSIQKLATANSAFGAMRTAFTKLLDRTYNEDYATNLSENDKTLKKALDEYSKISLDEKSKFILQEFNEDYNEYFKYVDLVKNAKKQGKEADPTYVPTLAKLGDNVITHLNELNNYESEKASLVYKENKAGNSKAITSFIIVFVIALIITLGITAIIYIVIKGSIKDFTDMLKALSSGDFTANIPKDEKNEFGLMKKELSLTIESISEILKSIKENTDMINDQTSSLSAVSEEMTASAQEVANAIQGVAQGSTSQAGELMEMAGGLNNFSSALDNIVVSVKNVDSNAKDINDKSKNSNKQLGELVDSIDNIKIAFKEVTGKISTLGTSIRQVNEITDLINSIADQTNLLALNAAIEAARAGEAGRGFSVVADEIRKLAEQSKNSSADINNLLSIISNETEGVILTTSTVNGELENQVKVINNSITSFKDIISSIETILPLIENVAKEIADLDDEKNQIISKVEAASAVAEENSASAEEIAASTQQMNNSSIEVSDSAQTLANIATQTLDEVNRFKL